MNVDDYIKSGILEAYVFGICTPEEMIDVQLMSKTYPQIKTAIEQFSAAIEQQLVNSALKPMPGLKAMIMEKIGA